MRVEPRGGGLRPRESDTRPYAERTLSVTTKLARFTRRHANFGRLGGHAAPGVDGERFARPAVKDSGWEPDGVTRQVRFCEEPGAESSHGRDIVAPPGNQAANREHQRLPKRGQGPGLLSDHDFHSVCISVRRKPWSVPVFRRWSVPVFRRSLAASRSYPPPRSTTPASRSGTDGGCRT